MTISVTQETGTAVIRGSILDLLELAVIAAGKSMPDFGEGEADSYGVEIYDGAGSGIAVGNAHPDAHFILTISDQEASA